MKNLLDTIVIRYPEYNFFRSLSSSEKIQYFFEIYDMEQKKISNNISNGLNTFFDELDAPIPGVEFDSIEFGNGKRVDIMIDNENIVIESNSLSAVREIAYKFVETGYIVRRDLGIEKMFRKDKITRYLRVFKIIGQSYCLCYS